MDAGLHYGASSVDMFAILKRPGGDIEEKIATARSIVTDSEHPLPHKAWV